MPPELGAREDARAGGQSHVGPRSIRAGAGFLGAFVLNLAGPALAAESYAAGSDRMGESPGIVGLSTFVGLVLFSTTTALLHLTGRKRWAKREATLASELTNARAKLDRAMVFLSSEPQISISWGTATDEPDIEGDLSLVTEAPIPRRVLGFGSWLPPEPAAELERCVERLRIRGESFRLALVSNNGRHLEAEGKAVAGRAVLRIRDVSGDRLELLRLRERHARLIAEHDTLRALIEAAPTPVWVRDAACRLTWVNDAYVKAVEAKDLREVLGKRTELLDERAREAAAKARAESKIWRARVPTVIVGERHLMDLVDVASPGGSAGLAIDLNELETVRNDLGRQMEAHARTLDQLATGVAIFDRARRLIFHNAAYRQIWSFDAATLEHNPSDPEILERLRAEERLPEQADFRTWKAQLMSAYQSNETTQQVWYLPDGRTLRVVTNPNPQGGLTYLYDDVTERFQIESRYNAVMRVQSETLDGLREGVAVFGTDGRLKFFNPAFVRVFGLDPTRFADNPHIDEVARMCAVSAPNASEWDRLRYIIAGLHDARTSSEMRLNRSDGGALDCATAPLPDGSTLVTFADVTASVNVERALTERNQALVDAEKLRNDFVHHVSYELRSPLTNIIGFAQLLGHETVGALNEKQKEYADHVMNSSSALLAIINDILDLATIDAGAMELQLTDVPILETMRAASDGLQDRLAEFSIRLQIVAMDDIGAFRADAKRIRQVLFNLLSNAIGFSSPGQTVSLAALRRDHEVVFKVSDSGRGISPDVLDRVFERFHTKTLGSRHHGVGIGLSIVRSFVELHGGHIHIESSPGLGTTVTCVFPTGAAELGAAEVA
jgi:signal transduction histidine kinase